MTVPTFQLMYAPGEWSEPATTDALIDGFDFGEWTEAGLDRALSRLQVGEKVSVSCFYNAAPDTTWAITLRRAE